jgi:hypothetical protein
MAAVPAEHARVPLRWDAARLLGCGVM